MAKITMIEGDMQSWRQPMESAIQRCMRIWCHPIDRSTGRVETAWGYYYVSQEALQWLYVFDYEGSDKVKYVRFDY